MHELRRSYSFSLGVERTSSNLAEELAQIQLMKFAPDLTDQDVLSPTLDGNACLMAAVVLLQPSGDLVLGRCCVTDCLMQVKASSSSCLQSMPLLRGCIVKIRTQARNIQ